MFFFLMLNLTGFFSFVLYGLVCWKLEMVGLMVLLQIWYECLVLSCLVSRKAAIDGFVFLKLEPHSTKFHFPLKMHF